MASGDRLERRGGRGDRHGLWRDDEASSNLGAEHAGGCDRHRRRGLARSYHRQRTGLPVELIERGDPCPHGALDETPGVDRSNPGPDDVREIVSKISERARQWVCLGSDQAESPVTTSNFLRSELTTSSALSQLHSCSICPRIRVSAASTSVMALSEK